MAAARPCVAVVGSSQVGRREAAASGLDEIHSLEELLGTEEALTRPAQALRTAVRGIARAWSTA